MRWPSYTAPAVARILPWGTACLLLAGCSKLQLNLGQPLPPEARAFATGETHYRDVLRTLGPPTKLSAMDPGILFLYEYVGVHEAQFGLTLSGLTTYDLIKFSMGRGTADREIAILLFDEDGMLNRQAYRQWHDDLGSGSTLQFIYNVVSLVDIKEFEVEPYAHTWGARLLEPNLARVLNRANSLETGQGGLEQIATPGGAGQHTLELEAE